MNDSKMYIMFIILNKENIIIEISPLTINLNRHAYDEIRLFT